MSPPPPIGTTTVSSGCVLVCSRSFEADRALAPPITSGSSNAGTRVAPVSCASRRCALERARVVGSFEYHLRAVQRGVRHLGEGGVGRHHDRGRDAEQPGVVGDALGVFPADAATTPRARWVAESCARKLRAPRSLNAPVNWRFSNFSHTCAPVMAESVCECAVG